MIKPPSRTSFEQPILDLMHRLGFVEVRAQDLLPALSDLENREGGKITLERVQRTLQFLEIRQEIKRTARGWYIIKGVELV